MPTPLPSTGYTIASVLTDLHDLLWELEADNKAKDIRYGEEDVIHSLKVFMHVASNVAIHQSLENKEDVHAVAQWHAEMGKRLADFTTEFTGVDPRTFYKRS